MYIYNVTTHVHWSIHEAWVQWMQQQHIPAVIATGCFEKHQMVRVLETDDTEVNICGAVFFRYER